MEYLVGFVIGVWIGWSTAFYIAGKRVDSMRATNNDMIKLVKSLKERVDRLS